MQASFNYYIPTRILFGPGKLKELATTPHLPGRKALIIIGAGNSMRKYGYLDRVQEYLQKNDTEYFVFDKILPNPISDHVDEGGQIAKEEGCDFIIGLGGGSSIDSAKSIAVMAKNSGEYWDYIHGGSGKGKNPSKGALPIVAITTTAGTGTEADPWTVVSKTETNEKIGWGKDYTFPVLSIVDPELMISVPPDLTAYQGMDAFFHAVEGYLATVHQPAADFFALDAIRLVTKYLPGVVSQGDDLEARTAMAWANTQAGFVESLSSCISHHSLEHAISAYYPQVPHGAGLTMTSMAYFSCLLNKNPERFADMAVAMGENIDLLNEAEKPYAFINALKKLIKNIGMENLSPLSYGINKTEAEKIAQNSFDTMGGLYDVNPAKLNLVDVKTIFENCY
jgi:alcohol dehydrogenase